MQTWTIVLLVITAILAILLVVLYFVGKKAQKKQDEQQAMMQANKQSVSMLIIDKKRLPVKESGLPQMVIDQTPKMMRRSKLPIIKAKVGPQIISLVCDEKIFDAIPVKKEVKAVVSGIYIMDVKALHGKLPKPEEKKKGCISACPSALLAHGTHCRNHQRCIPPDLQRYLRGTQYVLYHFPRTPGIAYHNPGI